MKWIAKALAENASEDVEKTVKVLDDIQRSFEDAAAADRGEDKFNLLKGAKLRKLCGLDKLCPQVGRDSSGMDKLLMITKTLRTITGELSEKDCTDATFNICLDTVKSVFGADPDAFAANQPTHHTKLHAFLLHYGEKLAQVCLV